MNRVPLLLIVITACAEPSEVQNLPEQPPAAPEAEGEPEPDEPQDDAEPVEVPDNPCAPDASAGELRVQETGIDSEDGQFFVRLGTKGESCDGAGSWGGWSVSIVFLEGRPVPGIYDLENDPGLRVGGSYSEGKTDGMTDPMLPGGTLYVHSVDSDGIVRGDVCGIGFEVVAPWDGSTRLVEVDRSFEAGPC